MVSRCKRYYAAAQQIPDQPAAYLTSFRERGSGSDRGGNGRWDRGLAGVRRRVEHPPRCGNRGFPSRACGSFPPRTPRRGRSREPHGHADGAHAGADGDEGLARGYGRCAAGHDDGDRQRTKLSFLLVLLTFVLVLEGRPRPPREPAAGRKRCASRQPHATATASISTRNEGETRRVTTTRGFAGKPEGCRNSVRLATWGSVGCAGAVVVPLHGGPHPLPICTRRRRARPLGGDPRPS